MAWGCQSAATGTGAAGEPDFGQEQEEAQAGPEAVQEKERFYGLVEALEKLAR